MIHLGKIILFNLLLISVITSCEKDPVTVNSSSEELLEQEFRARKGENNGKGKKNTPEPEPDTIVFNNIFQIYEVDEFDALYQFLLNDSGDKVLFRTDPTVTSWGNDLWGSWADPYSYNNGVVNYVKGLTNVTYVFVPLPGNKFDVSRTLVVSSYTGGPTTTTTTHLGVFSLIP